MRIAVTQNFQSPRSVSVDTLYTIVWDWRVLMAEQLHFYWPELLVPLLSSTAVLFFFISIGRYFGAALFGLIWCKSVSPILLLPSFFNTNNTNNKNKNYLKLCSVGISGSVLSAQMVCHSNISNLCTFSATSFHASFLVAVHNPRTIHFSFLQ